MKYTVEGFSQQMMVEAGMDSTDAVILRWFVDFCASGKMKTHVEGERSFYWVRYNYILDELPILGIQKTAVARRLQKMAESGVLVHKHLLFGGSYSYFGFGDRYEALLHSPSDFEVRGGLTSKSEGSDSKVTGVLLESQSRDSSSKDSSSKENMLSEKKIKKVKNRRAVTDYYQERFFDQYQAKPTWDGRIMKLVDADLARLGVDLLGQLAQSFFDSPPLFVQNKETGMGYNIFHSQIDTLLERRTRRKAAG